MTTPRLEGVKPRQQVRVDRYFDSESQAWRTIYEEKTVYGLIHQERKAWALSKIDGLGLPSAAPVLEVGSGAGLTSAALAERHFEVTAIDSAPAMTELTNQLARERGFDDRISASVADAHELPFPNDSFSLVVALGVLPWLHAPDRALEEMTRVVRPGGYVLANVDNLLRLHYLLDPRLNPAFGALRRGLGRELRRFGVLHSSAPIPARLRSTRSFDVALSRVGLDRVAGATYGFGPFTFLGRQVFSDLDGVRLQQLLKSLADRGVRALGSTGAQYVVLAQKPKRVHPKSQRGAFSE